MMFARFVIPLVLVSTLVSHAELRLPKVFGDHMVLQRDKPVAIWGWAERGKKVVVEFAGQSRSATADDEGGWSVRLEKLETSFEGRALKITDGKDAITISDVLVGEVWVCGGQSNMEWTLRGSRDGDMEIDSADSPALRFLRLPKIASIAPQDDFPVKNAEGNWRRGIPEEVENCTAVGYFFAKRILRRLRVPVGLIDTSWGGTMAQHWVSKETLRPFAEMKPYFEKFETALKEWNDGGGEVGAKKRFAADTTAWEKKRDEARAKGEKEPRGRPNRNAYTDPSSKGQPGGMYNGVLMPIASCTVRGALFYQGENNSFTVGWKPFPETFPAVIADWRKAFGDSRMPIGLIQIAGWSNRRSMTYDMNHHTNIVREVQHKTWEATDHTGLIVTYDTNSNGSIHPGRKQPVGERAARWALAEVYGVQRRDSKDPLEWRGPVFDSARVDQKKMIISFEEGTNRGLRLDQDVEVGFYLAGEDREFHHARARVIKDNQLEVWSDEVPAPLAVRYAWSNLPMGGLMNARELPAYPFRSDKWPLVPHQSTGEYRVE
jgi:sialate O-acetylesterase